MFVLSVRTSCAAAQRSENYSRQKKLFAEKKTRAHEAHEVIYLAKTPVKQLVQWYAGVPR